MMSGDELAERIVLDLPGSDLMWYPDRLTASVEVPDLHVAGETVKVFTPRWLPTGKFTPSILTAADLAVEALVASYRHEVEECLFIDGKLAFDPHPEAPGWRESRQIGSRK